MAEIRISDMTTATSVNDTDLVEIAQVDGNSSSGYATKKTTILAIATKILKGISFSDLATTSKQIIAAINELKNNKIDSSDKGTAGGVAELDSNGHVPASQLPSSVDDIVEGYYYNGKFYEEDTHETEIPAEAGKIYIDLASNNTYRWGGSVYVEISPSLSLGETSTTAYRGDRGKVAYDHATEAGRETTAKTLGLYKFSVTSEGHVGSGPVAAQKSDFTALGLLGEIDDALSPTSENPVKNNALYSALQDKENTADLAGDVTDIVVGLTDEQTTTAGNPVTLTTEQAGGAESAVVSFSPSQDLHGYANPWPGGAGKNKLPMTVSGIKSANTSGTWSGKTYTLNGVTFTIETDGDDNVTGINVNGTANNTAILILGILGDFLVNGSSYTFNGNPTNAQSYTQIQKSNGSGKVNTPNEFSMAYDSSDTDYYRWVIRCDSALVNNDTYYPMIRLATEQDATFAPYSNICPISGKSSLELTRTGVNQLNYNEWKAVGIKDGTAVFENNGITLTATANDCYTQYGSVGFPATARIRAFLGIPITISWDETTDTDGKVGIFPNGTSAGYVLVNNKDVKSVTYTPTAGVDFVSFRFGVTNNGNSISYKNIQVVYGTAIPTAYEPYNGEKHAQDLGGEYFSGYYDFETGVLTVDEKEIIIDGTETGWSYDIPYLTNPYNRFYCTGLPPLGATSATAFNGISNLLKNTQLTSENNAFRLRFVNNTNRIDIFTDAFDSLSALQTYLSSTPLQVCYELATPQTVQLTPQQINLLKGANIITTDGDSVQIKYSKIPGGNLAALVDYVRQLEARVAALES